MTRSPVYSYSHTRTPVYWVSVSWIHWDATQCWVLLAATNATGCISTLNVQCESAPKIWTSILVVLKLADSVHESMSPSSSIYIHKLWKIRWDDYRIYLIKRPGVYFILKSVKGAFKRGGRLFKEGVYCYVYSKTLAQQQLLCGWCLSLNLFLSLNLSHRSALCVGISLSAMNAS